MEAPIVLSVGKFLEITYLKDFYLYFRHLSYLQNPAMVKCLQYLMQILWKYKLSKEIAFEILSRATLFADCIRVLQLCRVHPFKYWNVKLKEQTVKMASYHAFFLQSYCNMLQACVHWNYFSICRFLSTTLLACWRIY